MKKVVGPFQTKSGRPVSNPPHVDLGAKHECSVRHDLSFQGGERIVIVIGLPHLPEIPTRREDSNSNPRQFLSNRAVSSLNRARAQNGATIQFEPPIDERGTSYVRPMIC